MSRFIQLPGVLVVVLVLISGIRPSAAQEPDRIVEEIRVEGNQRIEAETVFSYMVIAVGDPFDPERIDRSLKSLFATGLFADVTLRREGNALVVRVLENPIINRLAFEGNKRIGDDVMSAEVRLRPRVVYTRTKVQSDVARIVELYRRSGRFAATVEPKVIQLPQNRVDLVFEIDEGPLTSVRRISFIGNERFSDRKLRGQIQTKESVWYRFLTTDDTYDPDRLTFDRELLRRFYLSKGYAEFRVVSAVAELTRDRKDFFITFTVEEGERYRYGEVSLKSELRDLSVDDLLEHVETETGDWYDADEVEDTIQELTTVVGNLGYAFVDIRPRAERNRDALTIDLTYEIAEGSRVFVERINITGNFRTLDKVIRREFRLVEGDAFSSAKLRRSRQRIRNLGFFDKVDLTSSQGEISDKAVIDVEVSERATGELTFGAGVSSVDGLLADVAIRERNLLGRGQDLRLSFTLSGRRQELALSFTEPYFLDRELAAGFDVFRREVDITDEGSFDQESLGFSLRMGYPITERLRHNVNYTLREDKISDVDADASRFIKAQEGTSVTSSVGQTLLYDARDSRIDPSEGYFVRFTQDVAGIGGDVRHLRNRLSAAYFYSIFPDWVASVSASGGHIFGFGEDVRINNRFFIGGSDLRGFDTAGIGPRDNDTRDALGGNLFGTGSLELSFPLGFPKEFNVRGRLFADIGTLTEIDDEGPEILDEASPRASVGLGLTYISPFGPILIDFGVPILKEDFDETESVRFTFGTRF
ncbi:MAG: outer membrane protein assembly factor BamA [Alphaproteobacteria bacterium]